MTWGGGNRPCQGISMYGVWAELDQRLGLRQQKPEEDLLDSRCSRQCWPYWINAAVTQLLNNVITITGPYRFISLQFFNPGVTTTTKCNFKILKNTCVLTSMWCFVLAVCDMVRVRLGLTCFYCRLDRAKTPDLRGRHTPGSFYTLEHCSPLEKYFW